MQTGESRYRSINYMGIQYEKLLNEQGVYGDEKEAQKLYEQARDEVKFNIGVEFKYLYLK